jgi:prolyl-tRNA editing enzyme YbaK/EbsC (Cys-tRNA(Pro) deacylase)
MGWVAEPAFLFRRSLEKPRIMPSWSGSCAVSSYKGMKMAEGKPVFDRVEELLRQAGILFTVLRHEPVFTSEQAAAVRGTPLSSGAKALIIKADTFVMFVLPADRKLDNRKARTALGVRALRFATPEEVNQLTGLQPGSIPPFGSLFGLTTYCDPALADNASINFNAGDHAISVQMTYADYVQVEKPTLVSIT